MLSSSATSTLRSVAEPLPWNACTRQAPVTILYGVAQSGNNRIRLCPLTRALTGHDVVCAYRADARNARLLCNDRLRWRRPCRT